MLRGLALGGALARALLVYWLAVFPRARDELRRWSACAHAIDDPQLRALALGKLRSEELVAEGAAAFAVLAARRHRADVIRAVVAYEVLYDVVDAIGEAPAADPLAHNRAVHAALLDALDPSAPARRDDGGPLARDEACYVATLARGCRDALRRLPAHRIVTPALQRFAARAREAQSLNHAGAADGHRALARWAAAQGVRDAFWWEVAAAAGDPLGVFALVAAAGRPGTLRDDVTTVEQAYFPSIGALVWLLESLVDRCEDARTGNHSYVAHYASPQQATERLATVAVRAGAATRLLARAATHRVLLAGVASLYLSDAGATTPAAAAPAAAVRRALGWPVAALAAVLRLRRRLG